MAPDDDRKRAALALNRFGLGARPGDLAAVGGDARGFFLAEVRQRASAIADADLPSSTEGLQALREYDARIKAAREAPPPPPLPTFARVGGMEPNKPVGPVVLPYEMPLPQRFYRAELDARMQAAFAATGGFVERLVMFWSNHFAVSVAKGQPVRTIAGAFEREAIRPHVLGRFADMLLAVEKHPAMLVYLDNNQSIGPGSPGGKRRGRGLNENLAREILELHTLGVAGGYTQADVTSLARIITGWTIAGPEGKLGIPGSFAFNDNLHEPGAHVLLGTQYRQTGVAQGERALGDLARHPSTARHVARKLAAHFVADEPLLALVDRLARTFRETDGDLGAVAVSLLEAPEAWEPEARKIRLPYEFVIAALRATGAKPRPPQVINALNALGQPLWQPPGPNGFPDTVAAWASPEGIRARLDIAALLGRQPLTGIEPSALVDAILGPLASAETRQAVARAESRPQAVALFLMSPEFQRR